jgi:hypothetical protein
LHKIILIERDPSLYSAWPSLIRKKNISELSVEEVVSKYQGFEGELICSFEIKKAEDNFNKIVNECLELKELGSCLILHVISNHEEMAPFFEKQVIKMGFDVGICEKEKTVYSSIFHEVLFGTLDELISYKNLLNENLLFPDRSLAEKYVNLHDQMSAQGKDVEDYEKMVIYEVWRQQN